MGHGGHSNRFSLVASQVCTLIRAETGERESQFHQRPMRTDNNGLSTKTLCLLSPSSLRGCVYLLGHSGQHL